MTTPIVPTEDERPSDPGAVAPAAPPPPERRRRRWPWLFALGVVLASLVGVAFFVQLPYYLVQPGSVRQAEQRITISGAESYETDGEVMFTTVYVNKATLALLIRAQLDDAVEVRTEDEMYPDGDRDASRRLNLQRMDLSKLTATRVALEHLGIDASYTGDGARVIAVGEAAPAAEVLVPGDVVVEVDGVDIATPGDIGEALASSLPGEVVALRVARATGDGDDVELLDLKVELAESPTEPGRPVLGITADPADPRIESDVVVDVDSGDVSGPSAGLAWTLAIIDRMTPGSITDGRRVAVTGTIEDDGTVGPIGGVVQKVAAVKRAGIDRFLYPAATPEDEQAEMRRIAGDDVVLEPVGTIDEAVEVLVPGGVQLPA